LLRQHQDEPGDLATIGMRSSAANPAPARPARIQANELALMTTTRQEAGAAHGLDETRTRGFIYQR